MARPEQIPDDCEKCGRTTDRKVYVNGKWICRPCARGEDTSYLPAPRVYPVLTRCCECGRLTMDESDYCFQHLNGLI